MRLKRIYFFVSVILALMGQSAWAQRSTQLIQDDIEGSYRTVKRIMSSDNNNNSKKGRKRSRSVDLAICDPDAMYIKGHIRPAIVHLAEHIVTYDWIMRSLVIEESIWQPLLQKLESDLLSNVSNARAEGIYGSQYKRVFSKKVKSFVSELNSSISKSNNKYPKFTHDDECGGGGVEFSINLDKSVDHVEIIPKLLFRLCEHQNRVVAANPSSCDNWLPPLRNGETAYLGGIYKYVLVRGNSRGEIKEVDVDRYIKGRHNQFQVIFR